MSDLLTMISARTTLRRASSREHAGACPLCGGDPQTSDRLRVFNDGKWWCRRCDQGGDAVSWLRKVDGLSCPEAHAAAGESCTSTTCAARERCSLGKGHAPPPRRRLDPPAETVRSFVPGEAVGPQDAWREKAAALVDYAHEQLIGNETMLGYLSDRGLDRTAVERFKLGYLPGDLFRPRSPWGLAEELREDGRPKKLLIPQGIVIPFFDQGGVHRVRIRRDNPPAGHGRYYWLPGSGTDVAVIGAEAQAYVVVESDLDALLVVAAAGDLVGAVPLGSVVVKPKAQADARLVDALCILVALDNDEAGEKAWPWWENQYRRAARWPVPAGKDPGEFVQHAGDVRAWVRDGLRRYAPVLTIERRDNIAGANKMVGGDDHVIADEPTEGRGEVVLLRKVSRGGVPYAVVADEADLARGALEAPGHVLFVLAEIERCKGMSAEEADAVMMAKAVFCGAKVIERMVGDDC